MDRDCRTENPKSQDNLKSIDKDSQKGVLCRIFYSSFSNVISFEGKKSDFLNLGKVGDYDIRYNQMIISVYMTGENTFFGYIQKIMIITKMS